MSLLIMALFFQTRLFAQSTPSRPIGLIVWIEDGGPVSKSTLRDELSGLKAIRPELEYRRLRTFEGRVEKDIRTKLPKLLTSAGVVTDLVIGTHGATDEMENASVLVGLGGFSSQGARGMLSVLIEVLAAEGRLGLTIHVYLMGCGTMRGSAEQVAIRVTGLARDFERRGVRKLSCWGARQYIVPAAFRGKIKSVRERNLFVLKIPLAIAPTVLGLGYLAFYVLNPSSVLADVFLRNLAVVGLSAYPMAYVLARKLVRFDHGEDGYLTIVDQDGARVREVDFLRDPSSAKTERCEAELAPPVFSLPAADPDAA